MIHHLKIQNVRNLHSVSLSLAECNLIVGKNGSGKTSLLEAIFLLSRGKSFRHHEPKRYITHAMPSCAIWADTEQGSLAISKVLDEKKLASTILKVRHQIVQSQSTLTSILPVSLIDPSGMSVLENGTQDRRALLDWLVFHVEHGFYAEWLAYQRLLRQRNALLKTPTILSRQHELTAWDMTLAKHAHAIHEYRKLVFVKWQGYFGQMVAYLLPAYQDKLTLAYQAGFDEKVGLFEVLQQKVVSDVELGYTRMGSHRADLLVVLGDGREQAVNILSRGEKKLLITALKLSQLQLLCQTNPKIRPVVLVDDIDAELDEWAVDKMLDVLLSLPCQLVMTSLDKSNHERILSKIYAKSEPKTHKMFHVEHGIITTTDQSVLV